MFKFVVKIWEIVLTLNFESKGKACGNLTLKKKTSIIYFFQA
jgi:hypothetical protein